MSAVTISSVANFQSGAGVKLNGPRLIPAHRGVASANTGAASANTKEFPPFRLDIVNQCLWRRRDDATATGGAASAPGDDMRHVSDRERTA